MLASVGASVVVHYNNPNKMTDAEDTAANVQDLAAKAIV
jgi:hypothetical protein